MTTRDQITAHLQTVTAATLSELMTVTGAELRYARKILDRMEHAREITCMEGRYSLARLRVMQVDDPRHNETREEYCPRCQTARKFRFWAAYNGGAPKWKCTVCGKVTIGAEARARQTTAATFK